MESIQQFVPNIKESKISEPEAHYQILSEEDHTPVVYQSTVKMAENGHLLLDVDLPFAAGTDLLVKITRPKPFSLEIYKERMQALIAECAKNNPYQGMTKDQVLADLHRKREEMYGESLPRATTATFIPNC